MKNNLFNQSLMKKYAKNKAFEITVPKYDFLKIHAEKVENGDFKSEVSSYLYFYDFLRKILGYDREENILFDEKEDTGRGKSEFALKMDDKKFMVIELKDQNTDLDKPQTRLNDKRTPVDQAFDYAQHSGDINWVFVSNFKEFRLYNWKKKSNKFISFTNEDLLDKEKFKSFMLAFSKKSHVEDGYPEKLLKETLVVEKKLEHNFYKLFHETRLMLITELEGFNDLSRENAVHYAQLILNRYMFVSFAEDTGLLTSQISTDTIVTPIKKGNLRHRSIWQRLNELFLDINEGNEFKKIPAYNGGLFEEDLDFIKIRDTVDDPEIFKDSWQEWNFDEAYGKDIKPLVEPYSDIINPIYKNLLTISSFDFSSELDVNILGHIFENSIGDLEELKADTKGRRKKEGIFYTPEYITDYICKNTIIPYLSKSGNINTVEELIEEYSWGRDIDELDGKLANIKIVDPACGSGAFLNKATDVLLEIHEAIFDFKKGITKKTPMRTGRGKRRKTEDISHFDMGTIVFDAIEKRREILLQNIYGVDLNEESVEITKLSLFLKVCKKDKKLPALDNNIKCGNSLIDDPKYTDKPFNWEKEFSEISQAGVFDVVIGNPPYVRQEKIKEIKPFLKEKSKVYTGVADLYVYFFEKGIDILKDKGELGFISSNKFIKARYGTNLREFILKFTTFKNYVNHTYDDIFADATTYPSVFILKKEINPKNKILVDNSYKLAQSRLNSNSWSFERPEILDLKNKLNENGIKIKNISDIKIFYGIKTGLNEAFIIDENTKNSLIMSDPKNKEIIKPFISGKDIKKWKITNNLYLIFTKRGIDIDQYPVIKNYLNKFKERLTPKNHRQKIGRKPGDYQWFEIQDTVDYYLEFEKDKLIYPEMAQKLFAVFDPNMFYINKTCFAIRSETYNLLYLSALMSSKTLNFLIKFLGSPLRGNFYNFSKIFVEQLPIYPATPQQQQPFIKKADKMLQINQNLQIETKGFQNWLQTTFNIDKLSQKLEKYYELSFDGFLEEVRKKKVDVKTRNNHDLLKNEFEESLSIINPLLQEIEKTDNEIDQMVYKLYGLTDDEIKIIEDI